MDLNLLETLTTTFPGTLNDAALDNLYPALIQCFAVILCGYIKLGFRLVSTWIY